MPGTAPVDPHRVLPRLDWLAPGGFRLDARGRLVSRPDGSASARRGGLRVVPLVGLVSPEAGMGIFSRKESADEARRVLLALADDFDGLHLDFEYLPAEAGPAYADFLGRLRRAMRARERPGTLSMAMFPPLEFPARLAGFHRPELFKDAVDEVILMAYDYARPDGPPGPVTFWPGPLAMYANCAVISPLNASGSVFPSTVTTGPRAAVPASSPNGARERRRCVMGPGATFRAQ